MKKFTAILIVALLFCTTVFALPEPTKEFYVADYAGVMTEETEEYIINNSAELCKQTGAQIVVAALEDIGGANEREYGYDLATQWKIGDDDKDNGVLILLAMEERTLSIEVGYGLEGALNDAKTGRFMDDYAMGYLSEGDYDSGLKALYTAVLAEVYNEYGLEVPEEVDNAMQQESTDEDEAIGFLIAAVVIIIIIIINTKGGRGGRGRRIIFMPTSFRGNSFGSSSGGSFGGFSGGGGSFGGGGSSRKF